MARSTAENYRAMAVTTCEVTWLHELLKDPVLQHLPPTVFVVIIRLPSYCSKSCQHEKTKHVEIDCHFIRDKLAPGAITTQFVPSNADLLTKQLSVAQQRELLARLGAQTLDVNSEALLLCVLCSLPPHLRGSKGILTKLTMGVIVGI